MRTHLRKRRYGRRERLGILRGVPTGKAGRPHWSGWWQVAKWIVGDIVVAYFEMKMWAAARPLPPALRDDLTTAHALAIAHQVFSVMGSHFCSLALYGTSV
jgi:hypothetical protein